jgi:hypothetical protein
MSDKREAEQFALAQLESVRCLSCGVTYSKRSAVGTLEANPGCPVCGYVGWVRASRLTGRELRRFDADPRQRDSG